MFFFFFFQAEDGIRDYKVTGVQTCALPILAAVDASQATIEGVLPGSLLVVHHGLFWDGNVPVTGRRYRRLSTLLENDVAVYRSEERRVGKEGRYRRWA